MDTLHMSPRLRCQTPEFLRWVIVALSFLLVALLWSWQDIYRLATWSRVQLEMDDATPRRKLLALTVFALTLQVAAVVVAIAAHASGWHWFEWFAPTFVLAFLYTTASGMRFL